MDWSDFAKTVAAFGGLALGLWNLVSPRWTGVRVRKPSAGLEVINTGSRPVYVKALGWARAPGWELHGSDVKLQGIPADEIFTVEPWRSFRYPIDSRADINAALDKNLQPEPKPAIWFVWLENDSIFTTLRWWQWIDQWSIRKRIRTVPRRDWAEF
jgi:hypothetical protein